MKKLLSTLILFAFAIVGMAQQPDCWDGSVAESYAGGNGTPENPFQIATPQQLALLAQQTNFGTGGNAYYVLTNDICLNDNLNVNPHNWTPIGCVVDTIPSFFTGHFDGNKKIISGLYRESATNDAVVGLFGCTNNAEIHNVTLSGCKVTGSQYVGTLVGCAGLTNILDCYVEDASVTCEPRSAGGLVGFLGLPYGVNQNSYDTCHIVNCQAGEGVSVYGTMAGGLVGEITEFLLWGPSVPTVVSDCSSRAVLMGSEEVGGIAGFMRNGRVEECRCWNEVHSGQFAGGLVGMGINVDFNDCQNNAYVTGNYHCGGMAGKLYGGNLTNCDNYGGIQGAGLSSISKVGGMVGHYEPDPLLGGSPCENFIRNCHNHEEISYAGNDAGGIVGFAEGVGIEKLFIVDCSNTGRIYNSICSGGVLGDSNGYVMRLLNVYNTGNVSARSVLGGIAGELGLSSDLVINAYSVGELDHEIDTYVCPMGNIIGRSQTNEQFSSCYWLASSEHGSNGQGPELVNSSAFHATNSPSVWQLETPLHDTEDLLTALNVGAGQIETVFPALGSVNRWREDTQLCNGGFPLFANQWPVGVDEKETIENQFNVYPNPTEGIITISGFPMGEYRIGNMMGQTVLTGNINAENQQIDVSALPKGMYFISVGDMTLKFVVGK